MTISPIHHTNISVTDLERSIAFYRDALGYRVNMRAPVDKPEFQRYMRVGTETTGEMAMLDAGDPTVGMLELIQWDPPLERPTPPKRAGDPGPCMIVVEVKEQTLEDVRDRLAALGIEPWADIIEIAMRTDYPPFRGMIIEDPDGVLIELIQLPTLEEARAFRAAQRAQQPA